VVKGLEAAIRWFMPMLFLLLFVLVGYAFTTDGFQQGFDFMFGINWDAVTPNTVLVAMAHAFFTLSVGMGAIMAYGAYIPPNTSIARTRPSARSCKSATYRCTSSSLGTAP